MLKVWVARDHDKRLFLYNSEPMRHIGCAGYWRNENNESFLLPEDHPFGKDLTWEDEPREVLLVEAKSIVEAKQNLDIVYFKGVDDGKTKIRDEYKEVQAENKVLRKAL